MSFWWLWIIVAWVVLVPVIVHFSRKVDVLNCEWPLIPVVLSCIALLVVTLLFSIGGIGRHMEAEDCHNWSVQNDRPTKFASYTWWDYSCITPDGHGHWIPTSQIIVNIPKGES